MTLDGKLFAMVLVFAAASGHAQTRDWFLSVYSQAGTEVRYDRATFDLFALLNAAGLDDGERTPGRPIAMVSYVPVRARVREQLSKAGAAGAEAARAFVSAHAVTAQEYLSVLFQESAPARGVGARSPGGTALSRAKLDTALSGLARASSLDSVFVESTVSEREHLKALADAIDGPFERLKRLLGDVKFPLVQLVYNPLDVPGSVRSIRKTDQSVVVFVAPFQSVPVVDIVREVTAVILSPVVAKAVGQWKSREGVFALARERGAREESANDYALATVSLSLALQAAAAPPWLGEKYQSQGYFGLSDVPKAFADSRSIDQAVADALARIDRSRLEKK
jgi:hypothetical protein